MMSIAIKLAIDAKWYFEGPPSGRVVVKSLVDEMILQNDPRFSLHLIIDRIFLERAKTTFPANVTLIPVKARPNLISNALIVPLVLQRYKLDVVVFQNFPSIWSTGFKRIVYIHDVLFLDFPQYYSTPELLYFKPMKLMARISNYIITISNSEKKRLLSHGFAEEDRIKVVYHGIDKGFRPIHEHSAQDVTNVLQKYKLPDRYLLFVGRLNIRKNLTNLILSLQYITDPNIALVIVGKKDHKFEKLSAEITSLNSTTKIIFTGFVTESELSLIYAKATIFCFPSFAEGFGLPPLEAMKCGIPTIVSNTTCLPEICGDAATYVNPDDPKDIAEKVNHLIHDTAFYEEKGLASLKHARKFSWETSVKQVFEIVEHVK
jgi:glycosyltransferase involved in cell wall biosynthesis